MKKQRQETHEQDLLPEAGLCYGVVRDNTRNSDSQGHVEAFIFDMSNDGAPLEETIMSQGQEFLGRELSQRQLLLGVG